MIRSEGHLVAINCLAARAEQVACVVDEYAYVPMALDVPSSEHADRLEVGHVKQFCIDSRAGPLLDDPHCLFCAANIT
jgi:hypothetical protein